MTRNEWLAERRKGIGGSDVAGILGISPYSNPFSVWMDKTGKTELAPEEHDPAREILLEFGTQIEDVIANIYSRVTGRTLRKIAGVTPHPKFPVLVGSFDRLVVGERRGVEIKSQHQFAAGFGDPGTAEIPDYYAAQVAHYIAIADVDQWDLALMFGGLWRGIYTLERDRALEAETIDFLLSWWDRHVVADVRPEVDGSDGCSRYLASKFARNNLPLVDAGSSEADHAIELVRVRAELAELEATKTTLENLLKSAIGEHEGIRGDFGRITWKRTKDSTVVDFEKAIALARESVATLIRPLDGEEIVGEIDRIFATAIHTATTSQAGNRRFLVTPAKG